ncbi:IS110 family transposase [Paenibacillus sp. P36]|uniref:IS110 family transposase n=1 Tax=Paenibacillus sp. P36 TaxID=3342538 RepID=UPI0038B309DC
MKHTTKFIGLDVSKDKISVAVADAGRDEPRFVGHFPHKLEFVKKIMRQLGNAENLEVCYEAGPTGYVLFHWLTALGITCKVIAPSLIPVRTGDQIKTDKRDALRLATLFRAGELTAVHVPTPEQEALRDLVRSREDAKEDLHRDRQRVLKLLLRRQISHPPAIKNRWTRNYREWLTSLKWERESDQLMFQEYLQAIHESESRLQRLEASIIQYAQKGALGPVVKALQVLKGVAIISALTLVAEIGCFTRFRNPAMLMAYLGLVPREHSTGLSTRRGSITKAGNRGVRRTLVESSWSYRHKPSIGRELRKRMEGQEGELLAVSWRAQIRLNSKYCKLVYRGKESNVAVTAVARELVGFIWEIACKVERSVTA